MMFTMLQKILINIHINIKRLYNHQFIFININVKKLQFKNLGNSTDYSKKLKKLSEDFSFVVNLMLVLLMMVVCLNDFPLSAHTDLQDFHRKKPNLLMCLWDV